MSPLYLPWCVDASLFLQWYPSTATPGFDPGTFGSQARLLNHTATAAARILPLKLGVFLPCLCNCSQLRICLSAAHFIVSPQFHSSYHYEISHVCSVHQQKQFGVFSFTIFGQAQRPCPIKFLILPLTFCLLKMVLLFRTYPALLQSLLIAFP